MLAPHTRFSLAGEENKGVLLSLDFSFFFLCVCSIPAFFVLVTKCRPVLFFFLSAMFFPWMFPLFSFLYLKVVAAMMFGHVLNRSAVLAELFFFFSDSNRPVNDGQV